MIYNLQEIEELTKICIWPIDHNDFLFYTMLRIYDKTVTIYRHELEEKINGYIQPAYGFLHCTPLEEVPLYINTIPELARWRLMIAK
jgi:hypothetical protein